MNGTRHDVSDQVRAAIARVLDENLRRHGLRSVVVTAGPDHDGDPVLFVDAEIDLDPEPIDVGFTIDITQLVRDVLSEIGEYRFPHVRFHFHEDQAIAPSKPTRRKRA